MVVAAGSEVKDHLVMRPPLFHPFDEMQVAGAVVGT